MLHKCDACYTGNKFPHVQDEQGTTHLPYIDT